MKKDKTQLLTENKELFEESINEFSSKPYELASVNEIIKRSNYNKGSFYYRFKDKNELYIALLDYVFVQQIDMFKKSGFSLLTSNSLVDVLKQLYQNLLDTYNFDYRYYSILKHLYNEDSDFIKETLEKSVDSLYDRFTIKLNKMEEVNQSQLIIIDSLYKNFPIKDIINEKVSIKSVVNQIVSQDKQLSFKAMKTDNLTSKIEGIIDDKLNYFLLDNKFCNFDIEWFDIFKVSQNLKLLKNKLKFKVYRFNINLKSILNRYKVKPIFNHLAVENLIKSKYIEKIVNDNVLYKVCLGLIYAILDLREYIVINQGLNDLNQEQRDILFNYILPINGKLSKIIIADQILALHNHSIDYFYYYDELMGMKKFHIGDFKDKYYLKLHCYYMINNQYYHVYYNSFQSFLRFYQDNNIDIIKLSSSHELHLSDIREVVED